MGYKYLGYHLCFKGRQKAEGGGGVAKKYPTFMLRRGGGGGGGGHAGTFRHCDSMHFNARNNHVDIGSLNLNLELQGLV